MIERLDWNQGFWGSHKKGRKTKPLTIVKVLKEQRVFEGQSVRKAMKGFPNCPRDYLQLLNTSARYK